MWSHSAFLSRDVWCLCPVSNLGAVIWFHFTISSLVLLPTPIALSVLYFFLSRSPFFWLFSYRKFFNIFHFSLLCKGWGGCPLCLSGDSSVLMDLHRSCDCRAQNSTLSICSVSFFCKAFSWVILDSSNFSLFHSSQVFHELVCPLAVVLPQIFLSLSTLFSYPAFFCLFYAPPDVVQGSQFVFFQGGTFTTSMIFRGYFHTLFISLEGIRRTANPSLECNRILFQM